MDKHIAEVDASLQKTGLPTYSELLDVLRLVKPTIDVHECDMAVTRQISAVFAAVEQYKATPLRERLCTPMTVGQASIAASTVR